MRKVTIAKFKCHRKPKPKDEWFEHDVWTMQPGTAWRYDQYGNHEVVEVGESTCRKAEGWSTIHFDGRTMIAFEPVEGVSYLQPKEEDSRATEDRLGKKRKKRKLRAPRREAPGVAPASINWENDGPEPNEDSDRKSRRQSKAPPEGGTRPYRRAGPRGGLKLFGA